MTRARRRTAWALGAFVALVAVGATVTALYVRSQFYVGLDGEHVAIYRGVRGTVAGLDLATVEEKSTLSSDRLSVVERERLQDGIVASGHDDARAIVRRLIDDVCATPAPAVTAPLPTALPTRVPAAVPAVAPTGTPAPAPRPTPTASPTPCP
jgi:protein phosphatase